METGAVLEESLFVAITAAPTCPVLDGSKGWTVHRGGSGEADGDDAARARGDARDPAHPGNSRQRAAHAVDAQVLELVMRPSSFKRTPLTSSFKKQHQCIRFERSSPSTREGMLLFEDEAPPQALAHWLIKP